MLTIQSILLTAVLVVAVIFSLVPAHASDVLAILGTHQSGPNIGFSLARFDTDTGTMSRPEFLAEIEAPSYFAIHPDGKHLYTCNSIDNFEGTHEGAVSAFALEPKNGRLTLLNRRPSGGAEPCHLSLDRTGRYVFVANYGNGSVCVLGIRPDGSLGERTAFVQHDDPDVKKPSGGRAHAHSIVADPTNRFVLAADLGVDKIFICRFDDNTGTLAPNDPPFVSVKAGSGPRHIVFHPNGKFVYAINEFANTITAFRWFGTSGSLTELQTVSTLPDDYDGTSAAADILVHPNGRFLYGTNRGHNSVAVFDVDPENGWLAPIEQKPSQGKMPRNATLDPTGRWLLLSNHDSDNVVVFRVDDANGRLTQAGEPVAAPNPHCLRFLPSP